TELERSSISCFGIIPFANVPQGGWETGLELHLAIYGSYLDDPMIDPFTGVPILPVSEAEPQLHKMLNTGGCASITVGGENRFLTFDPTFHRPPKRLPWPFSKMQQQGCSFVVMVTSDKPW